MLQVQSPPDALSASLSEGDIVSIRNTSDAPFRYVFVDQRIAIPPGATTIVPWGHAVKLLGNPFLRDVGNNKARTEGFRNLQLYYGFSEGMDEAAWDRYAPPLEAYSASTGERIFMLVDDADGTLHGLPSSSSAMTVDDLSTRITRMSHELDALKRQQNTPQAAGEFLNDLPAKPAKAPRPRSVNSDGLPEDSPIATA